jgi:hypothetical protein
MDLDVRLIYRLIPKTHGLLGYTTFFSTTPINRFLEASFSVEGSTQRKSVCFWVSVDRYALYGVACNF